MWYLMFFCQTLYWIRNSNFGNSTYPIDVLHSFLSKIFYYDKIDLGLFYFHVRAVFFLTSNDLPPLIFWLSTLACTLKHLKRDLSNMIRAWIFSKNAMLHKFGSKKKFIYYLTSSFESFSFKTSTSNKQYGRIKH